MMRLPADDAEARPLLPDPPFDPHRRAFLGGLAALAAAPGLAALEGACARMAAAAPAATPLVKAGLLVRSSRPLDLETPVALLGHEVTPTASFFVRTHHDEPRLDARTWRLAIDGLVERPLSLTLADLKALPRHEVRAVLQCSGNGRAFYRPRVPGVPWEKGAVGCADWAGARLGDVLAKAGVRPEGLHVALQGADAPVLPTTPRFGRAIPIAKALDPDTLLAYEMNGEPLPYLHGHPVRAVVPGWVGDDWVKWLVGLTVQATPPDHFFVQTAYRYPTRPVTPGEKVEPADMGPMTALVVKSLITAPLDGARVKGRKVRVAGVAWTGADARVERVEVSADGGATWRECALGPDRRYAFRTWEALITVAPGPVRLMARAADDLGRVQPVGAPMWNPSGYQWNAADVVAVHVDA